MSWTNIAEFVFHASYPSGRTDRRLIDDFTRIIKEGFRARLSQEHFWPKPDDRDYVDGAGGKHRPKSARSYVVPLRSDGFPDFLPTLTDAEDNILYTIYVDHQGYDSEDSPDDTSGQWKGTTWVRHGRFLRPLVTRLRGKVRFNGLMHFMAEQQNWQGRTVSGLVVDEANVTRATASPDWSTDGIVLYPFYNHNAPAHKTTTPNLGTLIYPVRVGKIAASDHAISEVVAPDSEGVGFYIGNYPVGNGVMYAMTKRGLEIYTSGTFRSADVLVDGISLRKHNHTGGSMGAPIDASSIGGILYAVTRPVSATLVDLTDTNWKPISVFSYRTVFPDPPPPPDEQEMGFGVAMTQSTAQSMIVRLVATLQIVLDATTNAAVLSFGLGQNVSGNAEVRAAQTVPVVAGSVLEHYCTFEALYVPTTPFEQNTDITLFARKHEAAKTAKILSVTGTVTSMAWKDPETET